MIDIKIPSYKNLEIENIVFDYNGTIATDGIVSSKTKEKLNLLYDKVKIYVVTADTYGNAKENLTDTSVILNIISKENGAIDKVDFIRKIGKDKTIAIGNGNNDHLMLKEAKIGICLLGKEGTSTKSLINSDIVIGNIDDCLDLFLKPSRLKATLRG